MAKQLNDPIQTQRTIKTKFPKPIDVKEFLEKEFPNSESYWGDGILDPKSKMVISGPGKLGKSLFVSALGLSMATGRSFLNIPIPKKLKVLYIQQEISERNFQKRLKLAMQEVKSEAGYFACNTIRGFNILNDAHFEELKRWLKDGGYNVLIVDPIYKTHNEDENSSRDMKKITDRFDDIIEVFNLALILVHHHHKFNYKEGTGSHQLRGSTVLFDWGDSYIILNPLGKNKEIKLEWELRNAEEPIPLVIRRNKNLWYEVVRELGKQGYDTDDIIDVMKEFDRGIPIPQKDIVAKTKEFKGISDKTVRETLLPMAKKEGKVKSDKKGSGVFWTLL